MARSRIPFVQLSIALGVAAAVLGADVLIATKATGIAAIVAMGLAVIALTRESGLQAFRPTSARSFGGLLRLEAALVAACGVFALARTVILYRELALDSSSAADRAAAARLYDLLFLAHALSAGLLPLKLPFFARVLLRLGRRPPLLLAVSFAAMIAVGTLLLSLPFAVHDVASISILDSLFTMTSAVCVTGLTVNEVGATYTSFGQLVILLGIQFGGIGIMSVTAAALILRRDAPVRAQADYASLFEAGTLSELRGIVRVISATTLGFEAVGAALLWLAWHGDPRLAGHSEAWFAVFHSVSAFCNAGFSLFRGNLTAFAASPGTLAVIAALIVFGGIGFPVYRELLASARRRIDRLRGREVSRHEFAFSSRVVLATSGILVAAGGLAFLALEWNGSLAGLDLADRATNALFTSVTARTAGFNTVDLGAFGDAALLLLIALMFVGGSPSSTAGGVKTTTLAVMFATFRAELRREEPRLGRRAIPLETIRRATAVSALSLTTVVALLLALTLTESHAFLPLAFEAFSAFGTVGLSTGITPEISTSGRLVLILAMFLGRLGPMTIALAVGARRARPYRLPTAELQIW